MNRFWCVFAALYCLKGDKVFSLTQFIVFIAIKHYSVVKGRSPLAYVTENNRQVTYILIFFQVKYERGQQLERTQGWADRVDACGAEWVQEGVARRHALLHCQAHSQRHHRPPAPEECEFASNLYCSMVVWPSCGILRAYWIGSGITLYTDWFLA